MLTLFKEIEGILGVRASLAYIQGLGLIYADLPEDYNNPIVLGQLEIFIDNQQQAAKSFGTEIGSTEIRFGEATVITRTFDSYATLIVIADPQMNLGLLEVTLDLLQDELRQAAKNIRKNPNNALISDTQKSPATNNDPLLWTPSTLPPALQPAFEEIHQILSYTIGPLSNVIMNDSVKSWSTVGPCDPYRVNELIDIIGMEIGDTAIERRFRKTIQPILLNMLSNIEKRGTRTKQTNIPHKIMVSADLAKKLSQIMELFTEEIGQKGPIIMKGKLRKWAEASPPSEQRIPALLELLAEELKNSELAEKFKQNVIMVLR